MSGKYKVGPVMRSILAEIAHRTMARGPMTMQQFVDHYEKNASPTRRKTLMRQLYRAFGAAKECGLTIVHSRYYLDDCGSITHGFALYADPVELEDAFRGDPPKRRRKPGALLWPWVCPQKNGREAKWREVESRA